MSRSTKNIKGFRRHYAMDDSGNDLTIVPDSQLYFRRDRRASKRKKETDAYATWSDMHPKRKVRRNDNWERDVQQDD